jgi:fluoride exporter
MSSLDHWPVVAALTFAGSGLGGACRHLLSERLSRWKPASLPAPTWLVNVSGSFLIGLLAYAPWEGSGTGAAEHLRVFLIFGFAGGYTTVSAFSLQTWQLFAEGETGLGLAYAVGSLATCLLAAAAGGFLVSR